MALNYLIDGADAARHRLILAHGAGQGMDSAFMSDIVRLLASDEIRVIRFNFPYMTQQASSGKRRPPDREARLLSHWREVVSDIRTRRQGKLFIGGKSMGGRMASLVADELQVDGLICLGYPFHPPGRPERLRTQHLAELATPTLICQGERDSFGKPEEVADYQLSTSIQIHWLSDGDHSFKPRKASGLTLEENLQTAALAIHSFIGELR